MQTRGFQVSVTASVLHASQFSAVFGMAGTTNPKLYSTVEKRVTFLFFFFFFSL